MAVYSGSSERRYGTGRGRTAVSRCLLLDDTKSGHERRLSGLSAHAFNGQSAWGEINYSLTGFHKKKDKKKHSDECFCASWNGKRLELADIGRLFASVALHDFKADRFAVV